MQRATPAPSANMLGRRNCALPPLIGQAAYAGAAKVQHRLVGSGPASGG